MPDSYSPERRRNPRIRPGRASSSGRTAGPGAAARGGPAARHPRHGACGRAACRPARGARSASDRRTDSRSPGAPSTREAPPAVREDQELPVAEVPGQDQHAGLTRRAYRSPSTTPRPRTRPSRGGRRRVSRGRCASSAAIRPRLVNDSRRMRRRSARRRSGNASARLRMPTRGAAARTRARRARRRPPGAPRRERQRRERTHADAQRGVPQCDRGRRERRRPRSRRPARRGRPAGAAERASTTAMRAS